MQHFINRISGLKQRLEQRLGRRRLAWLSILGLIGASALAVRGLIASELDHSALLYLLIPYCTALLLAALRPEVTNAQDHRLRDFVLSSLIVLLGSSVLLGEGFICVLFFLPFYFVAIILAAITRALHRRYRNTKSNLQVSVVPLLVLALSMEGTTHWLAMERFNQVEQRALVALTPEQILQNMERPIQLNNARHWLLAIFPMPEVLSGQLLRSGERHRGAVHYPRWLVTNVHSGILELEVLRVSNAGVVSQVRSDSTLFKNYLDLQQIEVKLQPDASGRTQVSLIMRYRRHLDPAWYFQPTMRFAMERMADHIIKEVIARD